MKRRIFIVSIAMLISVLTTLPGCETQPTRDNVIGDMNSVLDDGIKSNQPKNKLPDSVSNALLPTIDLTKSKLPEMAGEERYDISVDNVPARQFFLSLVEGTSYNMVVHPEVTGNITVNLKNVTIPQVLEAVRDVYGYEFISTEYGFQVLPGRLQAKIFQINYLNIQRTGSSSTLVSSGALSTGGSRNEDNNNSSSSTRQSSSSVFGTEIHTKQPEIKFWSELQTSIQAIVGDGGGRNVVVNPQSGVVVVRALPSELREVETFLRATQLIVQRQVILEAKIIEVKLNSRHQTGINWSTVLTHSNNKIAASQIGGGSVLVNESGVSDIAGLQSNLRQNSTLVDPTKDLLDTTVTSAFGGVFSLALDLGDFTSFIELLKTQGAVQILSSPRVSTLNNQKAVIKVGQDEFFVTDVSTQNVSTAAATTIVPDVTLTPFFSGIALDVTPQISESGEVTLHVHPSISEVLDQEKTLTIGEQTQTLPLALSNVRETDSVVRARSGQVIVIGGLMQNSIDDNHASPGDIDRVPVVGNLFKHTNKKVVKSELVILLKPVVVEGDEQWRGAIQKSADSLRNLKEQL